MADIQLNSVTLATESGGTVVLDSAVQDNITRLGTVTSGAIGSAVTGTIGTGVTFPAGHILQVKGTNSNGTWGSISHSNEFHLPNQDVTITTKGLNSNYFIIGRYNCDDTNSSTCGVGMSFRYLIGSTETSLFTAHPHEIYSATAVDKYMVAHTQHYFSIATAIGTSITFKSYGRASNSNLQSALSAGCMGQATTVMEIQS